MKRIKVIIVFSAMLLMKGCIGFQVEIIINQPSVTLGQSVAITVKTNSQAKITKIEMTILHQELGLEDVYELEEDESFEYLPREPGYYSIEVLALNKNFLSGTAVTTFEVRDTTQTTTTSSVDSDTSTSLVPTSTSSVMTTTSVHPDTTSSSSSTTTANQSLWMVKDTTIIEIYYWFGQEWKQVAALDQACGALRLVYHPDGSWGTATYPPSYWHNNRYVKCGSIKNYTHYDQGLKKVIEAVATTPEIDNIDYTITLYPPEHLYTKADVALSISNDPLVDSRSITGEAFQLCVLASMKVSETEWDAQQAFAGNVSLDLPDQPFQGLIFPQPVLTRTFGLKGGTSADWKDNAPTVTVTMDREIYIQGWITQETDPNEDNIGMWGGLDEVVYEWSYTVEVTP